MKRKLLLLFILCLVQIVYSQSWRSATGKLYTYHPDSVKVGIGTAVTEERMQTDPGAYRAECWRNYREANALWITGWCLFSVGFSVDV